MAWWVELGNASAVEANKDDESGVIRLRPDPGEKVTRIGSDDDSMPMSGRFNAVIGALSFHFATDTLPVWVESSDANLASLVASHCRIDSNERPEGWGETS